MFIVYSRNSGLQLSYSVYTPLIRFFAASDAAQTGVRWVEIVGSYL